METPLTVREHGVEGPWVIVLHGGPAAAGEAAPLARGLAERFPFHVLEPWQRGSGGEPLTVSRHVADLHDLLRDRCGSERPALVGESWGAMLALAYAAEHPDDAGPIALVGCGTFDAQSRAVLRRTLAERTDSNLALRLEQLQEKISNPSLRLRAEQALTERLFLYDPLPTPPPHGEPPFDARAHEETWQDMLRRQAQGDYPAAFAAIRSPLLMLHGTYDPHPGRLIRDSLVPFIPQLEYREWERCGHQPWRERAVHDEFFALMGEWLSRAASGS